ncbi:hypothetical protein GGR51DRAFT_124066 [Nemania sp. FL0031]|nr:hypothetical protein GGR51DRAFT_124066 [Nemania sp. FL0031]
MVYVKPRKGTKRGPQKFSGSRRTRCDLRVPPVPPLTRPQRTHSRAFKAEIMLWLINNRVAVTETGQWGEPYLASASATRRGQVALTDEDRVALKKAFHVNGAIYRPPTFKEAAAFFKTSTCNIQGWWGVREKYLSPQDFDRSKKLPVCEVAPGIGIPKSAPRPQVFPETPATTDATGSADTGNTNNNDQSDAGELPLLRATETSDDSNFSLEGDDTDLSELENALNEELNPQTQQSRRESSDGGQHFEDAPEYQEGEEHEDDADADHEPVEEADMYGMG